MKEEENKNVHHLDVIFAAVGAGRHNHHDFGDKVDDGRGRLLGFQLGENVALVVGLARRFSSDKSKAATEKN